MRDVIALSPRPLLEVIDILFTVITGFPCIVDADWVNSDRYSGEGRDYAERASWWVNIFVGYQVRRVLKVTRFRNTKPGLRWTRSMVRKMAYVDKLRLQEGRLSANLQIVRTLSKLDEAHIVLEQGLAFKACGQKICYVAPTTLAEYVMNAIADVYLSRSDAYDFPRRGFSDSSICHLFEEDMDINEKRPRIQRYLGDGLRFLRTPSPGKLLRTL